MRRRNPATASGGRYRRTGEFDLSNRSHIGQHVPQPGHRTRIRTPVIAPTDGTVFIGGQDGIIRHRDLASGRGPGVVDRPARPADPMAIAPDGRTQLVTPLRRAETS